jgi:hypothetical protein
MKSIRESDPGKRKAITRLLLSEVETKHANEKATERGPEDDKESS